MKLDALDHPKTLDFAARLDISLPLAIGHLELLWAFVATKVPHGNVGKWPDGAIARGAQWYGDPSEFVQALTGAGFLDQDPEYRLLVHDWAHHSPNWLKAKLKRLGENFASPSDSEDDRECDRADDSAGVSADDRADSLRARHHATPRHATDTPPDGGESPASAADNSTATNANDKTPPCPAQEIIDEYHKRLPQLPRVGKLTRKRQSWLQARWRENNKHQELEFWQRFFDYIRDECPFLLGDNQRGWTANMEWLINETNFYKTIEGNYDRNKTAPA